MKITKMKSNIVAVFTAVALTTACSGGGENQKSNNTDQSQQEQAADENSGPKHYPKGIGEVKKVSLTDPMEEDMIKSGKAIYEMKCSSCHKLTGKRVVGPGWAGVTNRRSPEWVMNFVTNVEIMLAKDSAAQKMLEECLTRMPNQGLSVGDARDVLEFMRKNDVEQVGEKDEGVIN